MNAQIKFKAHKINHTFTYGVVGKNLHPIHACMQKNSFLNYLVKFLLCPHLIGCGKQDLKLSQVSPVYPWEIRISRTLVGYQGLPRWLSG